MLVEQIAKRTDLATYLRSLSRPVQGAELGVGSGDFSHYLLKHTSNLRLLYSIDKWNDHHNDRERLNCLHKLREFGSRPIVLRSTFENAAPLIEDQGLDFVYVDGYAHTGQESGQTLYHWYPKVREGGIISGHDYSDRWPRTRGEVDRFARTYGFELHISHGTTSVGDDRFPSWWCTKRFTRQETKVSFCNATPNGRCKRCGVEMLSDLATWTWCSAGCDGETDSSDRRSRREWLKELDGIEGGHVPVYGKRGMYDHGRHQVRELLHRGLWKPGDRILDLGCGNGRLAIGYCEEDIDYVGVDVSRPAIAFCERVFAIYPRCSFYRVDVHNAAYAPNGHGVADMGRFPFGDDSFDVVICCSLFTHLATESSARNYMAEIRRMLRPGGRAWLTWFRSPPNLPCSDARRTSYAESFIRETLRNFRIRHEQDGKTTFGGDQWKMLVEVV